MKLFAVCVVLAVTLVADQCHGKVWMAYKERPDYNADPPIPPLRVFDEPATLVFVSPTNTRECVYETCPALMKEIQSDDMTNRKLNDIGYNFVVGGCTGLFPGSGWDYVSPLSSLDSEPSLHIGVAGTYSASNVRTEVAEAVRNLIQDGISRGKINAYYKLGRRPGYSYSRNFITAIERILQKQYTQN